GRQARDPPVADDRCTRHIPHHTTMIDDRELDASPPTVHELVSSVFVDDFTADHLLDVFRKVRERIPLVVSQFSECFLTLFP
ncbi:hypothetical protein MTQ10_30490, partial [Streptomyces sp. XM83C]|uniref:hypothetical protein n=1 Tax=Streptomyces sp. XM83C TaxID=2929781 RepID=UPI001FF8FC53